MDHSGYAPSLHQVSVGFTAATTTLINICRELIFELMITEKYWCHKIYQPFDIFSYFSWCLAVIPNTLQNFIEFHMQFATHRVNDEDEPVLLCDDGSNSLWESQQISITDFVFLYGRNRHIRPILEHLRSTEFVYLNGSHFQTLILESSY